MWTDRPLISITLGDVQQLVTDKVRENRQLVYKDEQPTHPQANNDKKSEFAVDISALANGSGGLLIYGVAEEKENNRPTGIASVAVLDLRAEHGQGIVVDDGPGTRAPT